MNQKTLEKLNQKLPHLKGKAGALHPFIIEALGKDGEGGYSQNLSGRS